jgi:L-methionine (R)-S-oxide reductase
MRSPSPEFAQALRAIRGAVAAGGSAGERLQRTMELIRERHPRYTWVGIYVLRGDVLELGPFAGSPTEHTSIPVGVGVCGAAVAERANQVIADVRRLDNYLACSPSVRSEIVVLIWRGREIIGQIDADSDDLDAFGPDDEAFLTKVASELAPLVAEVREGPAPGPRDSRPPPAQRSRA